jgi:probable HAF family extracellular repeat protein
MTLKWLSLLVAITISISLACTAFAATHNPQNLGTLGGSTSLARAISSNGLVAGYSTTATGATHAFLWQNGVMQDLGTLGGSRSEAYGVNSKGEVVGWSTTSNGSIHAFLWRNGAMEDLGTLANQETEALAINDSSQIVGYSVVSGGMAVHPFLWQNGSMQDLGTILGYSAIASSINSTGDVAGWFYSTASHAHRAFLLHEGVATDLGILPTGSGDYYANDINDSGQIVGTAKNQFGITRPVWWQNGVIQDLGAPNTFGCANAINNSSQIVGYTYTDAAQSRAFLWVNGVTQSLDALSGYTTSQAYDINNNGWIVGTSGGQAVLWTPVPEPSSILALVGGIAGFGGLALRHKKWEPRLRPYEARYV